LLFYISVPIFLIRRPDSLYEPHIGYLVIF